MWRLSGELAVNCSTLVGKRTVSDGCATSWWHHQIRGWRWTEPTTCSTGDRHCQVGQVSWRCSIQAAVHQHTQLTMCIAWRTDASLVAIVEYKTVLNTCLQWVLQFVSFKVRKLILTTGRQLFNIYLTLQEFRPTTGNVNFRHRLHASSRLVMAYLDFLSDSISKIKWHSLERKHHHSSS